MARWTDVAGKVWWTFRPEEEKETFLEERWRKPLWEGGPNGGGSLEGEEG